MFHSVPCRAKVHETLGNLKQNVYKIKYKRNAYGGCVCVCVWVLWACNVRLTPKQLNVEIQEIQVNIKRRNYVNQKAGNFGSQQISKLAGHKSYIFFRLSAKASLSREEKKLLLSGPSQKWTSRAAATFAEQSVGSKVA